jgi:hypothetical protein
VCGDGKTPFPLEKHQQNASGNNKHLKKTEPAATLVPSFFAGM